MPFPAEAEAQQVYEEGRSVLASLITRLLAILHRLVDEALRVARQMITYISEHPLAALLLVTNIMIWVS